MNRRTALKNLTMSLGYTVAAPTIFNILSSCSAEADAWVPLFLSPEEKHMVTHLVDVILPASDTPGALDVNVPQFLDLMYNDIEKKENQQIFKKGASLFAKNFKSQFASESIIEGNKNQFETLLASYFNISDEETQAVLEEQRLPLEDIADLQMENYALYKFLLSVKEYTLFGYFTSEKIGEDVLNYDPVPRAFIACTTVDEATTNGRAWSL